LATVHLSGQLTLQIKFYTTWESPPIGKMSSVKN